jgi:hypothetical protein
LANPLPSGCDHGEASFSTAIWRGADKTVQEVKNKKVKIIILKMPMISITHPLINNYIERYFISHKISIRFSGGKFKGLSCDLSELREITLVIRAKRNQNRLPGRV